MAGLETAIGIATIIGIAESLDNLVRQHNYRAAMAKKKELDSIINRSNLEMSKIQNELNKAGIDYQRIMDRLQGVSRAGKAFEYKENIDSNYNKLQKQAKQKMDRIQSVVTGAMEEYQPQIDRLSNRGAFDEISSLVSNVKDKIVRKD